MKIGVLGSGNVGQALAKGLVAEGHEVYLATRAPKGDKADELTDAVPEATICDFATAAEAGELLILCTPWSAAQEAITLAGADHFVGKVVIDTNNIIDQHNGVMVYGGTGVSAAEQIQTWLPKSKVVKAFNTVGAALMYKPPFDTSPTMFIAGDDADAKAQAAEFAKAFGWEVLDTGGLAGARELEALAIVWIRNARATGQSHAFKML